MAVSSKCLFFCILLFLPSTTTTLSAAPVLFTPVIFTALFFFQNVLQLGQWVRATSLRQSDPAGDVRRKDRGHAGSVKTQRREEGWIKQTCSVQPYKRRTKNKSPLVKGAFWDLNTVPPVVLMFLSYNQFLIIVWSSYIHNSLYFCFIHIIIIFFFLKRSLIYPREFSNERY